MSSHGLDLCLILKEEQCLCLYNTLVTNIWIWLCEGLLGDDIWLRKLWQEISFSGLFFSGVKLLSENSQYFTTILHLTNNYFMKMLLPNFLVVKKEFHYKIIWDRLFLINAICKIGDTKHRLIHYCMRQIKPQMLHTTQVSKK